MNAILRGGLVLSDADVDLPIARDVQIQAGKVAGILDPGSPSEGQEFDVTGLWLIPGLVQTHTHVVQALFRGMADDLSLMEWLGERIWPLEAAHDEESAYWSARLGLTEMLLSGTTSILDMASVHHTDSIFRAAEESGIRASIGKAMMDRENAAGLSESTRTALDASHALRERWHGRGRLQYSYAPRFVPSCTEDLLRETVQEARAHGCLIHTHASENRDELALVRSLTGMDNIVYLHSIGMTGPDVVLAHCIHLTAEEQQILADTGTNVAHCPSSNLKLGSGIAPIPELLHAGVNCTLGSDGAPCNNRMDAFTEMRLAALIQKPRLGPGSLTARTVFDMATCAGAKALGLDTGRLHVGLEADIVAIDPNRIHAFSGGNATGTLVYSATAEMVQHVWIAGEQRVKDRLVHGWSTGETLAECGKALARVRASAGQ